MTTAPCMELFKQYPENRAIREQMRSCEFVSRDDFVELLVSFRRLTRFSVNRAGFAGLLDAASGECFVIEQAYL